MEKETLVRKSPARNWKKILAVAGAAIFLIGGTLATRDSLAPRNQSGASYTDSGSDYGSGTLYKSAASARSSEAAYALMAEDGSYEADMEEEVSFSNADTGAGQAEAGQAQSGKKIIRTISLTIGSKTYDETYAAIRGRVEEFGGWVEYAYESSDRAGLRSVTMTLRVPAEKLDVFNEATQRDGRVISRSESAEDVTASYRDTQGRLEAQQALMARLKALITDAADLSDLLALEQQIADTQYQIDSLQRSLNRTDRQVDYATVSLSLREETDADAREDRDLSFGERIAAALSTGLRGFRDFAEDMMIFLAAALPCLLILAVLAVILLLIRRHRKAKTK